MQRLAVELLGRAGKLPEQTLPALRKALTSPDEGIRKKAQELLRTSEDSARK